jgi:hypothetical protein
MTELVELIGGPLDGAVVGVESELTVSLEAHPRVFQAVEVDVKSPGDYLWDRVSRPSHSGTSRFVLHGVDLD